MPINQFLPFGTGAGANVLTNPQYNALTARLTGFQAGDAVSRQLNSVWRQSSVWAYVLGEVIKQKADVDANDDGNTSTLYSNFINGLLAIADEAIDDRIPWFDDRYIRVLPPVGAAFYVNFATGNDNNAGTLAAPFKTIQGAVDFISQTYVAVGTVTINVADSLSYQGFRIGPSLIGQWKIVGNPTTPANCRISATTISVNRGYGIDIQNAAVDINGFSVNSLQGCINYTASFGSVGNVRLMGAPSGALIASYSGSLVTLINSISITGGARYGLATATGSYMTLGYTDLATTTPVAFTISGTPAFTISFAASTTSATLYVYNGQTTFSGAATGRRFLASISGNIVTNGAGGNYFPGNVAGVTSTLGQYL